MSRHQRDDVLPGVACPGVSQVHIVVLFPRGKSLRGFFDA